MPMKIKEVTNPEEQLGLLRVIIDNTWAAIKQQADAHAKQKASQPTPKAKPKHPKVPYAPKPQPLPKPKVLNPIKSQPVMKSTIGKAIYKSPQARIDTPKPINTTLSANTNDSLSNLDKDEVLNLPRGALPKPL